MTTVGEVTSNLAYIKSRPSLNVSKVVKMFSRFAITLVALVGLLALGVTAGGKGPEGVGHDDTTTVPTDQCRNKGFCCKSQPLFRTGKYLVH